MNNLAMVGGLIRFSGLFVRKSDRVGEDFMTEGSEVVARW